MTKRTLDDFVNSSTGLFKDNTAGDISALDLRDFTETAYAGLYSGAVASVTTGDVTGVVGTMHVIDVSGMTADRDFILPSSAAVGDRVGVMLSTGDATYELDIHTPSGSSDQINGVDSSVGTASYTRLFITGEVMVFRCVDAAGPHWVVEYDGRIPQKCKVEDAGGTSVAINVSTQLEPDTTVFDNASIADITTDYAIKPRRTGDYFCSAFVRWDGMADGTQASYQVRIDGAQAFASSLASPAASTSLQGIASGVLSFNHLTQTEIQIWSFQSNTNPQTPIITAGNRASLTVVEQL